MQVSIPPQFKNGYTLSALLHVLVLLLFAFVAIKPALVQKWHQFEWDYETKEPDLETSAPRGITEAPAVQESPLPVTETLAPNPVESVPPGETERIIEPPKIATPATTPTKSPAVRVRKSTGINTLKNLGNTLPTGNMGFSGSLEQGSGEAYVISLPKPQIMPTEEGEVFIEFKLNSGGDVNMTSINVISYSSTLYVEAVKKTMRNWKFGFKNTYNPERLYRIRCKFVVDED